MWILCNGIHDLHSLWQPFMQKRGHQFERVYPKVRVRLNPSTKEEDHPPPKSSKIYPSITAEQFPSLNTFEQKQQKQQTLKNNKQPQKQKQNVEQKNQWGNANWASKLRKPVILNTQFEIHKFESVTQNIHEEIKTNREQNLVPKKQLKIWQFDWHIFQNVNVNLRCTFSSKFTISFWSNTKKRGQGEIQKAVQLPQFQWTQLNHFQKIHKIWVCANFTINISTTTKTRIQSKPFFSRSITPLSEQLEGGELEHLSLQSKYFSGMLGKTVSKNCSEPHNLIYEWKPDLVILQEIDHNKTNSIFVPPKHHHFDHHQNTGILIHESIPSCPSHDRTLSKNHFDTTVITFMPKNHSWCNTAISVYKNINKNKNSTMNNFVSWWVNTTNSLNQDSYFIAGDFNIEIPTFGSSTENNQVYGREVWHVLSKFFQFQDHQSKAHKYAFTLAKWITKQKNFKFRLRHNELFFKSHHPQDLESGEQQSSDHVMIWHKFPHQYSIQKNRIIKQNMSHNKSFGLNKQSNITTSSPQNLFVTIKGLVALLTLTQQSTHSQKSCYKLPCDQDYQANQPKQPKEMLQKCIWLEWQMRKNQKTESNLSNQINKTQEKTTKQLQLRQRNQTAVLKGTRFTKPTREIDQAKRDSWSTYFSQMGEKRCKNQLILNAE